MGVASGAISFRQVRRWTTQSSGPGENMCRKLSLTPRLPGPRCASMKTWATLRDGGNYSNSIPSVPNSPNSPLSLNAPDLVQCIFPMPTPTPNSNETYAAHIATMVAISQSGFFLETASATPPTAPPNTPIQMMLSSTHPAAPSNQLKFREAKTPARGTTAADASAITTQPTTVCFAIVKSPYSQAPIGHIVDSPSPHSVPTACDYHSSAQ